MSGPQRIQLRRTKGWRKPEGAIVVARPTIWGNPWRVGDIVGCDIDAPDRYRGAAAVITAELAVMLYELALTGPGMHRNTFTGLQVDDVHARNVLAGHDLACWCPLDQPCHADVLLRIANDPQEG